MTLASRAAEAGEDIDSCLELALRVGRELPLPGGGATLERWLTLAELARGNVTAARVAESSFLNCRRLCASDAFASARICGVER